MRAEKIAMSQRFREEETAVGGARGKVEGSPSATSTRETGKVEGTATLV
jgi:hypothetical protein